MESSPDTVELRKGFSIRVESVIPQKFQYLKTKTKGLLDVDEDNWIQTSQDVPVFNGGASTCALIYAFNKGNNEMLAGHFIPREQRVDRKFSPIPETDVERFIKTLSVTGLLESFNKYKSMLHQIKDWIERHGSEAVEVYLFAQHFLPKPKLIGDKLIDRFTLDSDLKEVGALPNKVADYRTKEVSHNPGSDTLYLPKMRTIYIASSMDI